ncbi:hypothetical protein KIW84_012952 [Lathyrus oleraceus]|uniref:Integrase catalytic domain-containing protein n=1 Tax=Pisum sativum TaxID=3888 RepID=A0A9D5GXC5_PEA|nr:hypothetical protein KIW84_012952 [Pisum sativum]
MMKELCQNFNIQHHNSSPYRPKMNGAVEAANKNIKKIVQKMVVTYRDWHEMLPFALHGYRTSVRTSTGATPYSLVYGMEAVLPVEVEIPSLRVLLDVKLDEAEWIRTRFNELSLIEEKRMAAICHGQLYQSRMKRAFDQKVRPRYFQVGDLVLKRILPPQTDHRGKWTPNYDGPYIVTKVFDGGALMLATMDGENFTSPVNSDAVFTTVLPQAFVSGHTLPSRVDSARLYIPSGVDSARLYLSSRSGCSLEFDARSIVPMPDPWFLSLKQNLGTVSVFAPPTESSLANRGCQNHCSFPQQQASNAIPSPIRVSGPEDGDHFPSRSPCLGLAFYPAFRIPACRIILHCILPNRAPPLLSFPISADADRHEVFRYPDRSGVQASFPVSRPKWRSGQFSGIQTEVAFRPVFRYPDRSGVQASFPVSRPKWRSGQFSGIQTEVAFRPVFRYPDRSGVQASFPVSRPKWRSGQFSGIQTEVAFRPVFRYPDRSGVQASVPMFRSKSFPVFRLMSGIPAMVISVLPFILVCKLTFFIQTDSHRTRRILLSRPPLCRF